MFDYSLCTCAPSHTELPCFYRALSSLRNLNTFFFPSTAIKVKQGPSSSFWFLGFRVKVKSSDMYFLALRTAGLRRTANTEAMNCYTPLCTSKQGSLPQLLIPQPWQEEHKVIKKYAVLENRDGHDQNQKDQESAGEVPRSQRGANPSKHWCS